MPLASREANMPGIHATVHGTAEEFGAPGHHVVGVNIVGCMKIARAMVAFGLS